MTHLPVIVGFGGVNSGGRTSFHHSYRRMTIDTLPASETSDTFANLATMMGLLHFENGKFLDNEGVECPPTEISNRFGKQILEGTLLRRIESQHFDVDRVPLSKRMMTSTENQSNIKLQTARRDLPNHIPENWRVSDDPLDPDRVKIEVSGDLEFLIPDTKTIRMRMMMTLMS